MLSDLAALIPRIESGALDEAAVYRLERAAATPAGARTGPGVLQCPICGLQAMRFLPFGLAGRRNARCPGCGSVERHRFLWLYLAWATDLLRGRHAVLHTAPEPWLEARLRALPTLAYTSLDRFDPAADLQADLTDLPLPDGAFDRVITSHVLEHVPDDRAAMRELARVLAPGGEAIVMVPYDPKRPATYEDPSMDTPARRLTAFGHPYHWRIYGADLLDRLAEAGLPGRAIDSRRFLTPHQRRRWRINRNHLIHCRRP
ncbi:MAG: methyltransferase domain-containing protein [Azospirillaceae bacterium]